MHDDDHVDITGWDESELRTLVADYRRRERLKDDELEDVRIDLEHARQEITNLEQQASDAKQARDEWERVARQAQQRIDGMEKELIVTRDDLTMMIRSHHTITSKILEAIGVKKD